MAAEANGIPFLDADGSLSASALLRLPNPHGRSMAFALIGAPQNPRAGLLLYVFYIEQGPERISS